MSPSRSLLLVCAALSFAAPARASWPTSAASPLAAGSGDDAQTDPVTIPALDGGCFVVWAEDGIIRVRRVTPGGETAPGWPEPGVVAGESVVPQSRPAAIEDGSGGLFIAWEQGPNAASRDIYAQHLTKDGTIFIAWLTTGVAVCLAPGEQSRPKVVSDPSHGLLCVWVDQREITGRAFLFGSRLDTYGFLGPDWPGPGKEIAPVRSASDPFSISSDGGGGLYAIFIAPDSTTHAQRLSPFAQVPAGWAPGTGIALGSGKAAPGSVSVAADFHGGAYFAWNSSEDAGNVRVARLGPAGSALPGWSAAGALACGAPGAQRLGGAIADGLGGVILGWEDHRADGSTHGDIYAQRYRPNGQLAPGWVANGVAVETSALDARAPSVVSDGVGGVLLAYPAAAPPGAPADLRGARFTLDGTRDAGWPSAGVPLTSDPWDNGAPSLSSAPLGSAYLVWCSGNPARAWLARLDGIGALGDPPVTEVLSAPPASAFALGAPVPSPSRGRVSLALRLAAESEVRVVVRDVGGRRIAEPFRARLPAGAHALEWDGLDRAGRPAPAGLYFLEVEAGGARAAKRVLLVR